MMETRVILDKIKEIEKFQSDKELADALKTNPNTLRGWLQRNSLQYEVVLQYAFDNNIDLNELFGKPNIDLKQYAESPVVIALNDAIAISGNETEVADYLKQYTLDKLFIKIFPNKAPLSFYERMSELIFPKTQRIILFMYKVLKHIAVDNQKPYEDSKKYLIDKINNFELISLENLGHGFTVFDKKKLISLIERLSEEEAKIIIFDAQKSIEMLSEHLDFLNKITY